MTNSLTLGKVAAGMLALPALLASAGTVEAKTARWDQPIFSPTHSEGLYLGAANLDSRTMVRAASLPSFTFDGTEYRFTDAHRVSEPRIVETDGIYQVAVDYVVPVEGGEVKATLSYTMADEARVNAGAGQLSAWVDFSGPQGDYAFRWRLDLDVGSDAGNVLEIARAGGEFQALGQEAVIDLNDDVQVEVVDVRSFQGGTALTFVPNAEDNARLHVATFRSGENGSLKGVVNGESLGDAGDLVVWYETRLFGVSGGLTGPDMESTTASRVNAVVEEDKMSGVPWLDASAYVFGVNRSIQSGFATGNINITNVYQSDGNLPDDSSSSNAELHSMMVGNKDYEYLDSSTNWYAWLGMVKASSSGGGVLGIMFDDGATNTDGKPRQGCAVFVDAHGTDADWPEGDTAQAEMILSATHEIGHSYNQHHEDYCPTQSWKDKATFRKNSAIMGYAFNDTGKWTFGFNSVESMTNDPEEYVRPGHGQPFTQGGQLTGTSTHLNNHSSTSCRRFCCR